MVILGIDPGYERLGWGIIRKTRTTSYVSCGLIETKSSPASDASNASVRRLREVASQIDALLRQYAPDVIAIESLFFFNNQKTVIGVAQARGAILATIGRWSQTVEVREFTPLQIKSIVAGDGQASKKAVEKMVRLQLLDVPGGLKDDTLDALACALAVAYTPSHG